MTERKKKTSPSPKSKGKKRAAAAPVADESAKPPKAKAAKPAAKKAKAGAKPAGRKATADSPVPLPAAHASATTAAGGVKRGRPAAGANTRELFSDGAHPDDVTKASGEAAPLASTPQSDGTTGGGTRSGASMTMSDVAEHLRHIGGMLELAGENMFRVRSYENAARSIEVMSGNLADNLADGTLEKTRGVGKSMLAKFEELRDTGAINQEKELSGKIPAGLFGVMEIPGIGPKKVKVFWEQLGVTSVAELKDACASGRVAELEGFGQKSADNILAAIGFSERTASRFHVHVAWAAAHKMDAVLAGLPQVKKHAMAGSLRRAKETIGDLDFLAVVDEADVEAVFDAFVNMPGVARVLGRGATKSSIMVESGIQIDLRLVREENFPFTLAYFTGSKEHNIVMRQRAIERGLRLNEYGLFGDDGSSVTCADETDIYAALGIPHYIPPELREDKGEFAAAEAGTLPELVQYDDLRGLFHMHTTASDGMLSLEETAEGMIARGYEYCGITDHSKTAIYANGLSPERLLQQVKEIAEYNAELAGTLHLFAGNEVDILPDGSLDYPDEVLAELDFVIASVHGAFLKDEQRMTDRIIRAIENPYTTMLGHPTGRLLLSREGYPLDVDAVLKKCAEHGVVVEINASPWRLDLDWRWCRRAKELGVKISINPDAHKPEGLDDPFFGIGVARKGWLTCDDVLNTMPLDAMAQWLKDHRRRRVGK